MASMIFDLNVRRPIRLLGELLSHVENGARLSLEGDLSQLDPRAQEIGSSKQTRKLRRNTLWPRQDFVVLPLNPDSIALIKRCVLETVGLSNRVIHVQIEQGGELIFAAYDNFDQGCVWATNAFGEDSLQRLVSEGVLRGFERRPGRHDETSR